jgi:hypothetical protein
MISSRLGIAQETLRNLSLCSIASFAKYICDGSNQIPSYSLLLAAFLKCQRLFRGQGPKRQQNH